MAETQPPLPSPLRPPPPPRRSGIVTPQQTTFTQRLAARLVFTAINTVAATIRFRLHDPHNAMAPTQAEPCIFAIWHNRLALCLVIYHRYVTRRQPHRRMAAMVSASRDGALLARILELFRVMPVRGSTSRRGPQALRELVTWADHGFDLAITPDGPRGPRYRLQEGVIALAQVTQRPIVPACYHLSRCIQAGSWDRFQIPIPFTVCHLQTGKPFTVPRDLPTADREELRQQVEAEMLRITQD